MNNTVEIKLSANTVKFLTALIVSSTLEGKTPIEKRGVFCRMLKHQAKVYANGGKEYDSPSEVEAYVNEAKKAGLIEGALDNEAEDPRTLTMK